MTNKGCIAGYYCLGILKYSFSLNSSITAGLQENIFHGQARACGPWKWTSPDIFQTSPKKIHFTKSPHIKVNKLWFWWVHYHLRTVIR